MPSNLRAPGTHYLELGGVVSGTSSETAEEKVYTFEGVEGLRLAFNGMTGDNVGATLYNPNGQVVFDKGNFQSSDSGVFTLTQNGLYHLVVSGEIAGDRDYSFQLLELSTAPDLTFNLPVSDSLDRGTQSQFYKFTGEVGEGLFFDSLSGHNSHRWQLIGPNNQSLFSKYLSEDYDFKLPQTGEYAILIEGGTSPAPINYSFRVFSHEDVTPDILIPGTGEMGSNPDGSIGLFPVKLGVEDGFGGTDIQEYNIRLWPDPDNSNPVIVSAPKTRFALDNEIYQYQLSSLDPDGDSPGGDSFASRLKYRLIDSPLGALIDGDTGELLWFPEKAAKSGDKVQFTVEVSDGRGGKNTQSFTVDVYNSLGKIQGAVFDDLNNNGFRDSKLIKGDNPAIVLAIDVSGSTAAPFVGPNGVDNVLEAQVAATKALIDSLVAQGLGDRINIGLIPHQANAVIQDMNPVTPEIDPYTTPNADNDNNGIPDIRQILDSYTPDGSNDFTKTVQTIESLVGVLPGDPNVIFMSDGYGRLDEAIASEVVSNLSAKGIGITAFGIGKYSTMSTIQKIDPDAIQLTDVEELVDIFSGWDPRYALEPLLENVTVYVDLDNDEKLDDGDPTQLTFKDDSESILGKNNYYYTFENLLPGTYPVRIVPPNNATQTAPLGVIVDNVTSSGGNFTHLFGLHFGGDEIPNSDPVFLTNPPLFTLEAGESLIYKAIATDPDFDNVTVELVLAPEGMAVDSETGTLIWTPTALQVSEYYAELQANRERLEAIGRGDFAPTEVKFDVLLRAVDGKGGQGLQYVEVELVPTNNAPVFTSIWSENLSPQVGKPFQYQAKAIDADGDEITYEIVSGLPNNAINPDTGLINWTPTSAQLGEKTITIKATDGQGGEALQTLTPVVIPARPNTSPTIISTPRNNARIGNVYLANLAVDNFDGDPLNFSLNRAPTGMNIDSFGQISWLPTASDFGAHTVEVSVGDGQGGSDIVSFTLEVSDRASNRAPSIISVPDVVTNLERVYQYPLQGTDPDGDLLLWSLDKAPEGVVIDPNTGVLSWQPTSHQLGEHAIAVRLTDGLGQFVGQEFTLSVTGINTPPEIVSTPGTIAAINRSYSYNVVGTDPENDPLSYSLGVHPNGMNIDAKTGEISWTPVGEQVGSNKVEVLVSDSQGGTSRQIYNLVVGTNAINHAPTITSNPVFIDDIGNPYSYRVQATDPDGNPLTYQLLKKPAADMTINPITGEVTWDNPTLGNHQIVVGAVDSGGLGAAQGFTLIARENQQPVIDSTSVPSTTATPGVVYSYDVRAKDPDGGLVTFSLDEVSRSKGMTLDALGRLRWTPNAENIGTHEIKVAIADDSGATVQQNFTVNVAADAIAPKRIDKTRTIVSLV